MVIEIRWNLDPQYNEPLYNEFLGITSNFLTPPVIVKYLKQNLDITKPLYSKHILQVPCPFVKSRFHCTKNTKMHTFMYSTLASKDEFVEVQ